VLVPSAPAQSPRASWRTISRNSGNRKRDLFRLADIIGASPARRQIILVQATTIGHVAHRLGKIKRLPELPGLLAAGFLIQIHGWACQDGHWRAKIVEVQADGLPAIIAGPRRRVPSHHLSRGLTLPPPGA
jgi:hypothetical protein